MSALVHEHMPLLCALGGAAAGENTVCVSQTAAWGSAKGAESGGEQVRSHKTQLTRS